MTNRSRVLWQQGDTPLPSWYCRVPNVVNPVWQKQKEHLLSTCVLVGLRCFYSGKTPKAGSKNAGVFFAQSIVVQKRIQETIHVASKEAFKMRGWVNINLTDDDKAEILADDVSVDVMIDDVGSLIFRGYRFSMAWDDYSDAVQSSLVCANPDDDNFGIGISSRHPDPVTSLKSLMHKFAKASALPWSEQLSHPKGNSWS